MPFIKRKGFFETGKISYLSIDHISPNPHQPRHHFSTEGLEELANSIQIHGILQPLSVRKTTEGYQLVAGERRLRGAKLAGLTQVPCLIVQLDDETSSLLALVENLQRQDLDFLEEAIALKSLIRTFHLSQDEVAQKIGKSQSSVANKLRLLRLPTQVLQNLQINGYSERHARALLRLPHATLQIEASDYIIEHGLTVAKTEAHVDYLLAPPPPVTPPTPPSSKPKPIILVKDIRLFLNSIHKGVALMNDAGISATCGREETESTILLTIEIPKSP